MSRCKHCQKLTHSEDLYVEYDIEDHDKVHELLSQEFWFSKYMYDLSELRKASINEFGKLKVGDIWIHFITKIKQTKD